MRKTLDVLWQGYVFAGAVLACILLVSYPIGIVYAGGWSGVGHDMWLLLFGRDDKVMFQLLMTRMFLWLPSLLLWVFGGGDVSFLEWLAPGLFISPVS